MQEKVSIMSMKCGQKNQSLGTTVRHHSASLMMPNSESRDGCFYPHLIPMKNTSTFSFACRLDESLSSFITLDLLAVKQK